MPDEAETVTVSEVLPTVRDRFAVTPLRVSSTVVTDASKPVAEAVMVYEPRGKEGKE